MSSSSEEDLKITLAYHEIENNSSRLWFYDINSKIIELCEFHQLFSD